MCAAESFPLGVVAQVEYGRDIWCTMMIIQQLKMLDDLSCFLCSLVWVNWKVVLCHVAMMSLSWCRPVMSELTELNWTELLGGANTMLMLQLNIRISQTSLKKGTSSLKYYSSVRLLWRHSDKAPAACFVSNLWHATTFETSVFLMKVKGARAD